MDVGFEMEHQDWATSSRLWIVAMVDAVRFLIDTPHSATSFKEDYYSSWDQWSTSSPLKPNFTQWDVAMYPSI